MPQAKLQNKYGLAPNQHDIIYIEENIIENNWNVLKTKKDSHQASVIFAFETDGEAWRAAKKIAEAIGGYFYGKTDPRQKQ